MGWGGGQMAKDSRFVDVNGSFEVTSSRYPRTAAQGVTAKSKCGVTVLLTSTLQTAAATIIMSCMGQHAQLHRQWSFLYKFTVAVCL